MIWSINFALCIVTFILGVAWAKRKPKPDWKAIAGRMYTILAYPEEDSAIYCCKRAIRVYEEAITNDRK